MSYQLAGPPHYTEDSFPDALHAVRRNDFHGALAWVRAWEAAHNGVSPPGDQMAVLLQLQDDPTHLLAALSNSV